VLRSIQTGVYGLIYRDKRKFVEDKCFVRFSCAASVAINLPTVSFNGTSWSGTPDLTKTGVITTVLLALMLIYVPVPLIRVTATVAAGTTIRLQNQLTVNGTMIFKTNPVWYK
jgi:hypothetical protein